MSHFHVLTTNHRAQLGEGPVWCAAENAIYWVDIMGPSVHRLSLSDGRTDSWSMPRTIGWIVERRSGRGFIAGFEDGFAELTLDPLRIQPILNPELGSLNIRMNDAKVDQVGRIWAGTMDRDGAEPVGALYRLDCDYRCTKMDEGYRVTNGPTFSPDGRFLYHTDSFRRTIYRFELQDDGSLQHKISFITIEAEAGYPDGMTCDLEGCLWVAHFGGARVTRFTPDGEIDAVVPLPATQITSCVFAGPELDRLILTSAACDGATEPLAGEVFEIDPGVRGAPATPFGG